MTTLDKNSIANMKRNISIKNGLSLQTKGINAFMTETEGYTKFSEMFQKFNTLHGLEKDHDLFLGLDVLMYNRHLNGSFKNNIRYNSELVRFEHARFPHINMDNEVITYIKTIKQETRVKWFDALLKLV